MKKRNRAPVTLIGIIIVLIIGIVTALANDRNPEDEVIGGDDAPTDIWIGEEDED